MAKAKMVMDMRLRKRIGIEAANMGGVKGSLPMDTAGMAGVIYVYKSKRQALKAGCKEDDLAEIRLI